MEFRVSREDGKKSGIYIIRNILDDRIYIGSTNIFKKRYDNHRNDLQRGIHDSVHLQRFYNKYGKDTIYFSILEIVDDINSLIEREQYYLDNLQPFERNGFNTNKVANSMVGFKHSEESKRNMSIGQKKRPPPTEETRKKISLQISGENNPIYGKERNIETRLRAAEKLSKEVVQFGLTGELLNIFSSLAEASLETGLSKDKIRSAARNKCRYAGQYKWAYIDNGEKKTLSKERVDEMRRNRNSKIIQVGAGGIKIAEFKNIKSAAKHNKVSRDRIAMVLKTGELANNCLFKRVYAE